MSYVATKAQVKAMEILLRINKEVPLKTFIGLMWGSAVAPNFARHFLSSLVSSNYVAVVTPKKEDSNEDETYSITPTGSAALSLQQWRCLYCGKEFFEMARRPAPKSCRRCGGEHTLCRKCLRRQVVVGGEWPLWKPVLRSCPGASQKAD